MSEEKKHYVAYAGTYTTGSSHGIHIYDVDVETGSLFLRRVVPVRNCSYLTPSKDGRFIYSLADEGVQVFEVRPDGDLVAINKILIDGMRGHHLTVDKNGRYVFIGGYHDGKVTMIHTHKDGSLGSQMDGIYHKGVGGIRERSWRPHVTCVRVTPDNRFLCAVDSALDMVAIYRIDTKANKLVPTDCLRMGRVAGPRVIHFTKDRRFAYILCEISCSVRVYKYWNDENGFPKFEYLEEYSVLQGKQDIYDCACSMRFSRDEDYLYTTAGGDNSVAIFRIDKETGRLTRVLALPIGGIYPKDANLFPNEKYLAVCNNKSNTIAVFAVDFEKGTLALKGKPQKIDQPNCLFFRRIERAPDVIRNISNEEAEAEAAEEIRREKAVIASALESMEP